METGDTKQHLDPKATITIILITLIWGVNFSVIKYTNAGLSPVFAAAMRSVIASICGVVYVWRTRQTLFHRDLRLVYGIIAGLLFGVDFVLTYWGMLYTDSARSVVFKFLTPFMVVIGAHFFLRGDRLTWKKFLGLILAFTGTVIVFYGRPRSAQPTMIVGDLLEVVAALVWAISTIYIKRFMAERVHPINTFLYQLVFSIPILMGTCLIFESRWIFRIDLPIVAAMLFQSVLVAFVTFFMWFKLIHRYPVSRLSVFTFLTPIFGVFSGILFLGEAFTLSLLWGVTLTCFGILLVNWRRGSGGS